MKKYTATPIALVLAAVIPMFSSIGTVYASPFTGLSDAEQSYHDQIFDYVMNTVNPNEKHDWASYGGKGTITVGQVFASKSKANCREYTEDFNVQGTAGKIKGYACRRSNGDGWCRLKENQEVLSCALEGNGFSISTGTGGAGAGGAYSVTGPTINAPDVSIGNVSGPTVNVNVDTPNIRMPNIKGSGGGKRAQKSNDGKPDPGNNNGKGEASDTAYTVTDTLGSGAARGTGAAIGLFQDWFR